MNDIHQISVPTPFSVGDVNCYLVDAGPVTVIDPGPKTEDAYRALVAGLQSEGYQPEDVDRILVTHPHTDHFGLASRLKRASGATVMAHAHAAAELADPLEKFRREKEFFVPFLISVGVPEGSARVATQLPKPYVEYFEESVTVDRELRDGDTIEAGLDLSVVHTPGHAIGCVCFHAPARGVLFSGDHVLQEITPNPVLTVKRTELARTRNLPTYLQSLERILDIDAEIGYGGHRERIPALHERVRETINHHENRRDYIERLLGEDSRTVYEITREMFPELPITEMFLGISEVIGHLDLLEDDARVEHFERDGIVYYETI